MHIVYVSREYAPSKRGGGIASYVKDMAEYMVSAGHSVTVICASDDTRIEREVVKGQLRVIYLKGGDFVIPSVEGNSIWKKLRMLYRFKQYRRRVRKTILKLKSIDVIEVAEFGAEALNLLDLPVPVIVRLHTPTCLDRNTCKRKRYGISGLPYLYIDHYEIKVLNKALYITSCSKCLASWVSNYCMRTQKSINCISNPLNLNGWNSNKGGDNRPFTILFVGTVVEEKGIGSLIQACELVRKGGIPVELSIVGKMGTYGVRLRDMYSESSDWCRFYGEIERNDLVNFYLTHELVCLPSFWEAFGIVCLEAMYFNGLVIGSSNGGMAEIIQDGVNGFLVSPRSEELLAGKISDVVKLKNEDKQEIRNMARKRICEVYSADVVVPQFVTYYNEVIADFHEKNKHIVG